MHFPDIYVADAEMHSLGLFIDPHGLGSHNAARSLIREHGNQLKFFNNNSLAEC